VIPDRRISTRGLPTGVVSAWYRKGVVDTTNWLGFSNGAYAETGLWNGYQDGMNSCNCVAYSQYWADTLPGGTGQVFHTYANISPTGVNRTFQISRAATTNRFIFFFDGFHSGTTRDLGAWTGSTLQLGGELAAISSTNPAGSHADTFDMYVSGINGSGTLFNLGTATGTYHETTFNGLAGGTSQWHWNKL
jgi:hypothetical protein